MVHNADSVEGNFFLHENCRDMHPWKYITVSNLYSPVKLAENIY